MRAPDLLADRNESTNRWLRRFAAVFVVSLTILAGIGVGAGLAVIHRAHDAAEAAREAASEARASAASTNRLVLAMAPCNPGDPPQSPGCRRKTEADARTDDALRRLNEALAGAIEDHDRNSRAAHEALQRQTAPGGRAEALPPRTPVAPTPVPPSMTSVITAPPTTVPTTTASSLPPPTTTTTVDPIPRVAACTDVLPNGRCRPAHGRR